jgi:hypothetical protein
VCVCPWQVLRVLIGETLLIDSIGGPQVRQTHTQTLGHARMQRRLLQLQFGSTQPLHRL